MVLLLGGGLGPSNQCYNPTEPGPKGHARSPVNLMLPDLGVPRSIEPPATVGPAPRLHDLVPESRGRLVRFIVTSALGGGVAPTAVIALYADLAGDAQAVHYADQRFVLRQVPTDWLEIDDRVADLEASARSRGFDLASAWQRAQRVSVHVDDPLEQLARLAGTSVIASPGRRSIFDDPEDLDELEPELDQARLQPLTDRSPDILDLDTAAQDQVRRFAIEERLERGLPPVELLNLYRTFETQGDSRARQYLDRVFVEHESPPDWLDLKADAERVVRLAEARGRDAGRLFADILRASPGMDAVVALQLVAERLDLGIP